jgi:hypothetical protein
MRGHSDVRGDMSEQDGRDIPTFVKWDGCRSTIFVAESFVRTALSNLDKTEVL